MFERILFICIGNICRSPMAEALLKKRLADKNIELKIEISSAGLGAMVNHPAATQVKTILKQHGIDITAHKARSLTSQMIIDADLILTMETFHKKEIERRYPFACGKVFLLGKWSDFEVPDPYGCEIEDFHEVYRLINQGIDDWLEKICKTD